MKLPILNIGGLIPKFPIIQGGMGVGVSLGNLAGAVAKSGGIGVISSAQVGFMEDDFAQNIAAANVRALIKEIRKAREIAPDGIIGVNIMVATTNYADMVMAAVREKIDIIISGAGLPKALPELVKGTDVKIVPIVSSKRAAETIAKMWIKRHDRKPDAFLIEGPMAGGHLGFAPDDLIKGSEPDVYEITKEIVAIAGDIPVITAGGIYDAADMMKVFELGATGVQIASRFVCTYECDAHQNFKDAYIEANEEDIVIVKSPVGLPGRAINNAFAQRAAKGPIPVESCMNCINECNPATTPYCITDALVKSVTGDTVGGLLFAGQNACRIDKMMSVEELLTELVTPFEKE